jgi:glycosyltransferase involved in cell wall biosynthesis
MSTLQILIAIHHFPQRHLAGGELRAFEEARWLLAGGHGVQVVCVDSIDEQQLPGDLGVRHESVEGVPTTRLSYDLQSTADPLLSSYAHPLIEHFFDQLLAERSFDLLHLLSGYLLGLAPLKAARRAGVPTVVSLLDYWFICPTIHLLKGDGSLCTGPEPIECARCLADQKRRYRLLDERVPGLVRRFFKLRETTLPGKTAFRAKLDRLHQRKIDLLTALNSVDAAIAPTRFLRDMYVRNGVRSEQLTVIEHSSDSDTPCDPAPPPARAASATFRIGYLGQLAPMKGVEVLLRAFKRLRSRNREVELRVFGDPRALPRYAARLRNVAKGDARIRFLGRYERRQQAALMQELDLVVVPSLWYENSPQVIREAFAYRIPVVATRLGGMAELVRDEVDGLLFERGSVAGLAAQLRRVVEDPSLYERLRTSIAPVQSLNHELSELAQIFERVVAKAAAPSLRFTQ